MRRLSAQYVFPCDGPPIKHGVIEVDNDGTILSIQHPDTNKPELPRVEFFNGILVPGFINTHCHTELSHLKNKIDERTGMGGFIKQVQRKRNSFSRDEKDKALKNALEEMQKTGIVAVGDICNSSETFPIKTEYQLAIYNFIEIFGIDVQKNEALLKNAKEIVSASKNLNMNSSISPHASYSVSSKLFEQIFSSAGNLPISLHNQETNEENEMFEKGSGNLLKALYELDENYKRWMPTKQSALLSIAHHLNHNGNLLLIHNIFCSEKDIKYMEKTRENIFWVLCPNSNLFIHNILPNLNMIAVCATNICIGTDSSASNKQLSVLEELKTIQQHAPHLSLDTIINWATINGARALNMSDTLGSFKTGKKPGVLLIENINFEQLKLKADSKVKRLV